MTPESQQIAIAEACGLPKPYSMWSGKDRNTPCHSVMVNNGVKRGIPIPDYLNDLNAMHEAEQVLPAGQWDRYAQWLRELTSSNRRFLIAHATAAQRAEAFLRTIGKWEDAK